MEKFVKELNNEFKGRTFIYKSKYGRTKGIVENIFASDTILLDEDTENRLAYLFNHSVKGDKTMERPESKGTEEYTASRPEFHVRSTNGIIYGFNECYFI